MTKQKKDILDQGVEAVAKVIAFPFKVIHKVSEEVKKPVEEEDEK